MPEDGVVSGYAFRLGDRNVVGVVELRKQARESFERALAEGRSAALLDQERGSLFTQLLGNVPPRAEIVCTLTIDQGLVWVDEGAWEWRFPTVVAPRYLGAEGRIVDAARVSVDVAGGAIAATARLALVVKDALTGAVSSPSHAIATRSEAGGYEVSLVGERGAALDRDLVVRWPVAVARVGVSLRTTRVPRRTRPSPMACSRWSRRRRSTWALRSVAISACCSTPRARWTVRRLPKPVASRARSSIRWATAISSR